MYKSLSVMLIILGVLLGLLFLTHFFSLVTNVVVWISAGDWLSLGKRILTTFVFGALGYRSFTAGRRRLREEAADAAT